MRNTLTLSIILFSFTVSAQESIIKDFAETRKDLKYCLYPSTLRMVNIQKDPAFNELVNDIEKLLIYKLDSASTASSAYLEWTKKCQENGFEEYIAIYGPTNLFVYGKAEEYLGVSGSGDNMLAFYLRGEIGLHKIPTLMQTFEGGDVLNLITDRLTE